MILKVLKDSFMMLRDEPEMFLPKLVSTFSASIFLVFLASRFESLAASSPQLVLPGMLAVTVLLSIMGVYSSMMLSSMVKNSSNLREAFNETGTKMRSVVGASLGVMAFAFLLSIISIAGFYATVSTGNPLYVIWGVIATLALLIAASYVIYFLPVTLLEERNVFEAVKSSHGVSSRNRKVVILLLLFSLALIAVAVASSGLMEGLGYAGFVAGRLVSSVVNTYLFVVSPKYYVEESGSKDID